jgi:hypothetical protein
MRGQQSQPRAVDAASFDLRPWYARTDARHLLRLCVQSPPRLASCGKRFGRTTDQWNVFNPSDPRVIQLHEICRTHLRPLFDHGVASPLVIDAGGLVTVDMAIDAVLPNPVSGAAGDPAYAARLPKIDLALGRSAPSITGVSQ